MLDRNIFSERLIELRTKKKIMAKDIAEYIGVSKQAFSQYEKQQSTPSTDILIAISKYFNVSLDYLTGLTDYPDIFNSKQRLTEEELELIQDFRLLNKYEQNIIIGKISEMIYNKNIEKNSIEAAEEIAEIDYKSKLNK